MENAAKIKAEAEQSRKSADMLWVTLCAALVFFMQAGFALVEAGFTRQKNTVNILMKNITDFTCGSIIFWLIGFGFMFGIGAAGFIPEFFDSSGSPKGELFAFLLFQSVFAGTATTIVSGAMAERTKFVSYIIFSVIMTGLIYPIFGNFAWKGLFPGNEKGILESMGFIDFAGSTVVHSIGAWAGLAGTLLLGPRLERYHDNKIEPIFGHNMSLAALGVFILWFGWFGFNPGSTGSIQGSSFPVIAVTTNLSASAGAISAMIFSWIVFKLPDMGITLNGILGGLVAVTAGCNNINPFSAIL
ncbi:MAG TPA: ammonium transporter, partial [Leptospiraceae bacterium]|nr:ammonium transporter [Leptospiraceae bacterium]